MCQTLANLCVLQLYSLNTIVCRLFNDLQRETDDLSQQEPFYKD